MRRDAWVRIGHLTPNGSGPNEIDLSFEGRSDPESQWKDEIAAGVYAAHGFRLTWLDPGRGGSLVYPVRRVLAPLSASNLLAVIREAAKRARVRLDGIELLKPMGYAPVVTISVPKPAAFQRKGGIAWPELNNRIEGFFLICGNGRGRVYARGGIAPRLGVGAGFIPGSVHG